MGPPPNYLITRKLVRHFFRKYLPQEPINKANVISELQESIVRIPQHIQRSKMVLIIQTHFLLLIE